MEATRNMTDRLSFNNMLTDFCDSLRPWKRPTRKEPFSCEVTEATGARELSS